MIYIIEQDQVIGAKTNMGLSFFAQQVVMTTGTFLGGIIHIGMQQSQGGRAGDPPANALAQRLRERPFRIERLKDGNTPKNRQTHCRLQCDASSNQEIHQDQSCR